jgi:hypothetical protein
MLETYIGEAIGVVTLVDQFAQLRGTLGERPLPNPPLRFSLDGVIQLAAQSNPSGSYVFANETHDGARIAPGNYTLRIDSDDYQRLEIIVQWPMEPHAIPVQFLRPGPAYPFPDVSLPSAHITLLRGNVLQGAGGVPLVKATVAITTPPNLGPLTSAITDANGAFALAFRHANLNPLDAILTITPDGGAPFDIPHVAITPARDNSLHYTALRGFVQSTTGKAIANAEISVDLVPNVTVHSGRNGQWAFYLDFEQPDGAAQVTAVAPNGNSQSVSVQVINRATVVVPAFHIA